MNLSVRTTEERDRRAIRRDVARVGAWLVVALLGATGLRALPWLPRAAVWALVALLGFLAGFGVIANVGRASATLRARRRRYWVDIVGDSRLVYQERASNLDIRRLELAASRIQMSPWGVSGWEVQVPSEGDWPKEVPGWAHDRRAEVLRNIVDNYGGGTHFRFVEAPPSDRIGPTGPQ